MPWFPLALAAAACTATVDALSKQALARSDAYTVAWVRLGYTVPFLAAVLPAVPRPPLDGLFFGSLLLLLPLEVAALLLYTRAIQESPLGVTVPFLALTPVFLMGTAFLILGERPDASGAAGILLIAGGAYLLNVHARRGGLLAPFGAVAREPGSRKMIAVAAIYSVTSVLGKVAILHSSPAFFGVVYFPMLAAASLPFLAALRGGPGLRALLSQPRLFAAIGLVQTLMIFAHVHALALVEVPYMISVKRTSLVFSVVLGRIFFGEEHTPQRLAGAAAMAAAPARRWGVCSSPKKIRPSTTEKTRLVRFTEIMYGTSTRARAWTWAKIIRVWTRPMAAKRRGCESRARRPGPPRSAARNGSEAAASMGK